MYFVEKILVNTTKELLEQGAWLHLPITLKSLFPNNKILLDYAARFVFQFDMIALAMKYKNQTWE